MQAKVHSFGSEGERVCWVHLSGPVCDLFVVTVYLPHRGRVAPDQNQTLADVRKVLADIPARDCICLLGDFNEQLKANLDGVTGKWTGGPASANASKVTDFLRLHNLIAINTLFSPSKHSSVHTFLQPVRKGSDDVDTSDPGEHVGASVKSCYKGQTHEVIVEAVCGTQRGPKWVVRFSDGYVTTIGRKRLNKMLLHTESIKMGKQLDYIFVSRR